ncbi:Phage shock protein A (IM30), suppresses sigma54-dependent transcription [Methanocella conradii HZ254]|uniref:Phage shock protein A (IM30), suppresses sigma54-dependent transcription n=1 Tax=Methanocella conradii (strain DSM 24694 / JCM 17849 / CGMCC 1.5162 / HZ254) TaxID=1041930 RepID=H8I7R8_METCZ|nr:PspA/IM30 family protein [Methanocella conradii]AFC99903.1 Phage shock protein A (IM30), suppresses sigma54-dependent transcription [Methanocella conradii HZ254]
MAGLLGRLTATIKAKLSRLLDTFEDPRETLDYSYKRQLELQADVKKGIASVITARKRLELQKSKLEAGIQRLNEQAREAVAAGRDDLASIALQRKMDMMAQVDSLTAQIEDLKRQEDKLADTARKLDAKIELFRAEKETIKAQYTAAEAKVKITEATTGIGEEMADVGYAVQRARDKTEEMQARSEALDTMVEQGTIEDVLGNKDLVEKELTKIKNEAAVKRELETLKQEVGR